MMSYILRLRQQVDVLGTRYDLSHVHIARENQLGHAQVSPGDTGKGAIFHTADRERDIAFILAARDVDEVPGAYDIKGPSNQMLGAIHKLRVSSVFRSTYRLDTPQGTFVGRERTWWRPIARRVLAASTSLPLLLPVQFDFTDGEGKAALTIKRQPRQPGLYDLIVHDDELDWRVTAACAVAVDALMTFWMPGPKIART